MTSTAAGSNTTIERTRTPMSWGLRALAALGVLVSALVHLYLWKYQDYSTYGWIGPAFLLQGLGGIVLAVLLLVWRSPLVLLGAVAYGAGSIVALLISIKWGIPTGSFTLHEQTSGPVWKYEIYSFVSEGLATLAGLVAIAVERRMKSRATA